MKTTMTPRVRDDIYLHLAEASRPEDKKPNEQRGQGLDHTLLVYVLYFVLALMFGLGLLLCLASCVLLLAYILSVPTRYGAASKAVYPALGVFLGACGGDLMLRVCGLIRHGNAVFVGLGTLIWGLVVLRYPLDPRALSLTLCLIPLGGYCVCKELGLVARLRGRPRSCPVSPMMVGVALVGSVLAFGMLAFMDGLLPMGVLDFSSRFRYTSP